MDARCFTTTQPGPRRQWLRLRQSRRRVGLCLYRSRFAGRISRRRQELQDHAYEADPGRPLLVLHRPRQPDAVTARNRPDQRGSRQHVSQSEKERRWLGDYLLRPQGAGRPGGQLDTDHAGQGMERDPASVWANRGVAQQDLEAGRYRVGELKGRQNNEKLRKKLCLNYKSFGRCVHGSARP
jgi:hypothetical protein